MEILLDLLKEIRSDLKNNPSKEEFNTLQDRVKTLEENNNKNLVKIASIAGTVSILTNLAVALVVKFLMH
jgi:hypothetical protein